MIILLLFGLHTISAQLKNIPPPPAIPRLDVASLPNHLQKLLAPVKDVQSNLEVQGPQTISRAHTYGMSLRSGQGEVWNDITGNYINDIASSGPISPSNNEDPRKSNSYHQKAKAEETAAPQTSSGETDAIENYKDGSNDDQRLSSINPPQTLPLEEPENEDQRGNSDPDKIISSDITVQSQNIPVPTKLEDQKFKKAPSAKTYGMNLAGGHGHVWNNIGGSHLDVNDATPSESVYPESKDKHYSAGAKNGNKFVSPATLQPVVYSTITEATSETPAIVNYNNYNQNLPTVTTINPATTVESQNPVPSMAPTNKEDYEVANEIKKASSPKTYGMNLSGGHGHVWNNIDESHLNINKATPSKSVQPELKHKTTPATDAAATDVDKFTVTSTEKPIYNTSLEVKTEEPAIVKYKESNHNQNLPSVTTIKPVTAVTSQNYVPTNIKDYKVDNGFKKYPSPKTYGMNLAGGHGHVWNNIDESHFDINKATPSKSVQPELKDKTTPAAADVDNFTWTTPVKPVVYTKTLEATSEKPAIVNYKDATSSKSAQLDFKDKISPVATSNHDLTSTTIVKPIVYTMSPKASTEKPAVVTHKDNIQYNTNQNLPSVTTTNPVTTVKSQKPVSPKAADPKFENEIKKAPSSTYGMNLSGNHGYVWNNIGGSLEHFDDNTSITSPSKLTEPEDNLIPAPTDTVGNYKDSNKFYQESPSVTTVNLATYPYYTTYETLTENATRIPNPYRSYNQNIPSVTTPRMLIEKAPTYVKTEKDNENQNQAPLSKSYFKKPNTSNKDILKRASPRTYGMRLEGNHGYVWNDLIEPGMHYNLDDETNDSNNPTTVNDVNPSEVPVTEKPTEDVTSANVDPTLPESTAQPSTESYRITPTERNKNNDSSSNDSSELEPEDDLLKYIEKLVKDEVAKLLENTKEKNPDKAPVTTEKSSNNGNETINTEPPTNSTEDPNTSDVSTSTEKVNETTVLVTTERWTEPTSTEAFGKPSTKTPRVNNTTEANDTEKNTTSNKVTPESNEELKKYIEKLVREEVAKRLENAMKADNTNDKDTKDIDKDKQRDKKPLKENANNTLDNIPKNVTNFYGSLIGEGNITNIFIFYPNDKNLESVVNDAKNIIKPQKNKSNETEADSNKNRPTESPSTLITESSTTTNTERPATESTNTPYYKESTSSEKDNDTISVTTENSTDSTTSETKTDSSTESYETTTKGSPNTTTEANNKKDDETPELKEEIRKYIDKLVKDEVADQLDKERKNGMEKEKEPDVVPVTTEKPNNDTTKPTSSESPTSEKNTDAPDSTNPTTSNEQGRETTSETTEKSNDTNDIMSTEPPTTEEASTQSSEKTTTDTPNINSTTEANTKNKDGTPSEPKIPDSVDELKKYVEKLVKDEVSKLLDADKNNGSKKENETDIIPVTTEKANNDSTDTSSTESPATEKNTEAPDNTNFSTSSEQDSETTPVTTEKTNNDTTDKTSTESPVTENNTGAPDSANATKINQEDRETNPDPIEKSNNDTNDTMSPESSTTEIASTQSGEKTTTETPYTNSSTEANEKNEDGSPSEPKMPISADELKKYVEKLTKDEVAKLLDAEKNNGSKKENEPDVVPVTTEKSDSVTTDTMKSESLATEISTQAPDSTKATTSSEQDSETTPVTTEKTDNDTTDTMSTETPATKENTEAPDSTNATASSKSDNDTTPVTTEGSTGSTSEANKEQASTESSSSTSTTEANKENDETTSSNMKPKSKEEIKKYVEQLVKEEVAKLLAAGKDDASTNEDAKPANATDEDAPVAS